MTEKTKQLLILLAMFVGVVVLWDTMLIYPIKLFVVMLHEISHGLMAELVGGDIVSIEIDPRIGGVCRSSRPPGFFPTFMIASAGYLGSLFWGAFIFLVAVHTDYDRVLSALIGVGSLIITYFVFKSGGLFGIIFCSLFSIFMLGSAKYLPQTFHDYFLKFIGLTSCLYVVIDINSDLISRSGIGSDADKIAEMTGVPSILIGIAWMLIALIIVILMLRNSIRKSASTSI